MQTIDEIIDLYYSELRKSEEYKRLLELKEYINSNYKNLIIGMKTKESIYLDSKEKGYLTDLIANDFSAAKTKLFEKEEVKEYFKLEAKINEILNNDFNDLKSSISNKFKEKRLIKL